MHVSELQRSELFSESWITLTRIIGKVCWTETHCPPIHDILVRMMTTEEIVK